jgi:hypothetical protein
MFKEESYTRINLMFVPAPPSSCASAAIAAKSSPSLQPTPTMPHWSYPVSKPNAKSKPKMVKLKKPKIGGWKTIGPKTRSKYQREKVKSKTSS